MYIDNPRTSIGEYKILTIDRFGTILKVTNQGIITQDVISDAKIISNSGL
jgi:hypothetical protein